MRLGLTDMIGLAASLIFALPLANYAIVRLFAGEVALGVGLLAVAAAMVVLPQYFLDPGRILRGLLTGLLPRQLRELIMPDTVETGPDNAGSVEGSSTEDEATDATHEDATAVEK
ncbi:DUF7533 family protein [Halorubrum lacusprofundi]|jgi:hypothetical protein|uniref:Uncharacterized protein n=1 Tax=Halorubrum lacusprofundi (strain ATCC 49239 / DSM 5036 / JCM 8891 / ACAM 34) TaxID=416348 RepID=B9LRI3_HALLT|nr:hypothetical protein [Halorubrum lacusprofundi]ACM55806.1 conserved hypothetical protein [Halorubrum lacusprofundi ATCC 49239]MCG1006676.1 hypothetical protein [Halorubrum lacusprofundi]